MAEDRSAAPARLVLSLVLSRDELLVVLNVLNAPSIPGLDQDPLGEMSPEQRRLASLVGARCLHARGLAQVGADGQLLLHRGLLTAVGASAYSQNAVFALHWPSASATPVRLFGHLRGSDVVAHTPHTEVLHTFALLPAKEQLIEQLLAFCQCEERNAAAPLGFTISRQDFAKVRETASNGDAAGAATLLAATQAPEATPRAFAGIWVNGPRVSILQALKQQEDGVHRRDITLVQDSQYAWLAVPASGDTESPLRVRSVTRKEIAQLFAEWL